jgi:hypothetical protein
MSAEVTTPRPRVTCWPRDGRLKIDLSHYVVDLNVTAALKPPMGFQLVLAADTDRVDRLGAIVRRIRLQALVSIGVDRPGGIMLGLVDSISQAHHLVGGQVAYSLSLTGSDVVGKALVRDNILLSLLTEEAAPAFFDHLRRVLGPDHPLLLELASQFGPSNPEDPVPYFTSRTIQGVVDWAVEKVPSMVFPMLQHAIGGTGRIGDYIDTSHSVTTWNDQRIYSEAPQNYSGTLLGFLESVAEPDFYEVWTSYTPTETEIPTGHLIVRPKPFDDPAAVIAPVAEDPGIGWNDLRTLVTRQSQHTIGLDRIHQMQTELSDRNAIGYYTVTSAHELMGNDQQAAEGLRFPLVDTFILTKFGAQSMEPRLTLVAPAFDDKVSGDIDYEGEIPAAVREFRNRLFNWYRWNPWFEDGTVMVAGADFYRPGDRLYFPDHQHPYADLPGMVAYCVGVAWSWSLGGPYTTTLRFERGHNAAVYDAARQEIAADAARYGVVPTHYTES